MEHSWIHIVGVFKQKYCYKCANDMLAIHYIGCIREWQQSLYKSICPNFHSCQTVLIVPLLMDHSWIHIVGVLKKNYCYECANDMLAIHYMGDIR